MTDMSGRGPLNLMNVCVVLCVYMCIVYAHVHKYTQMAIIIIVIIARY